MQAGSADCRNWTRIQSINTLEASRAFRFRSEIRQTVFEDLGMRDDSRVLEVGCGTGIFADYLAAGMPQGTVLGVDITDEFIRFADDHRTTHGNLEFFTGDAYALPLGDGTVDCCTSYTLLAILRDPLAALREQIRVTKKGGMVSGIEVVRSNISYAGRQHSSLVADDAEGLAALRAKWGRIYLEHVEPMEREAQGYGWKGSVEELPLLFEEVGLRQVRIRGFLSTFSTSDSTYDEEKRRWFLSQIGEHELHEIAQIWEDWRDVFAAHGFSSGEYHQMRKLVAKEQGLRESDFDQGYRPWAWHGTANLIVAGTV